jgi:hypothetical protein
MGGGRAKFLPNNFTDFEYPSKTGSRQDGRNLVQVPMDFMSFISLAALNHPHLFCLMVPRVVGMGRHARPKW